MRNFIRAELQNCCILTIRLDRTQLFFYNKGEHLRFDKENTVKKRLYDFSAAGAVMTVAAYALLLTLFGCTFFFSGRRPAYAVIFILLIVSFLFVLWYFVLLAPHLEQDGVHQGVKFIARDDMACRTQYDVRFREGVIVLRHKSQDYTELDAKAKKKKTIRVQATPANLKKLGAYLGHPLEAPRKPPRAKRHKQEEKNDEEHKEN